MVFPLKHLDLVGTGRRLHCGREKQKSRDPCVCKHFGHVTANQSRPLQSVYRGAGGIIDRGVNMDWGGIFHFQW